MYFSVIHCEEIDKMNLFAQLIFWKNLQSYLAASIWLRDCLSAFDLASEFLQTITLLKLAFYELINDFFHYYTFFAPWLVTDYCIHIIEAQFLQILYLLILVAPSYVEMNDFASCTLILYFVILEPIISPKADLSRPPTHRIAVLSSAR